MRKLLTSLFFVVLMAQPALAGRSTLDIDQTGPYSMGDQVTFTFQQDRTDFPWIQNICEQNGRVVYEEWKGMYSGYYNPGPFTLGPTVSWQEGAAKCEARLISFDRSGDKPLVLAKVSYSVEG